MKVIFGASGHAREIESFIRSDYSISKVDFFIDIHSKKKLKGINVLSEEKFIERIQNTNEKVEAYIAIGNYKVRKKIITKLLAYKNIVFPNLVFNSTIGDFENVELGIGNLFFPSSILTTDIKIGNHNHFNLKTSISHDCQIGNYNTFSPAVSIAGNVTIGNNNFFGVGSSVIDNILIADNVTIGAGSVVVNDIKVPGVYAGVPAKMLRALSL